MKSSSRYTVSFMFFIIEDLRERLDKLKDKYGYLSESQLFEDNFEIVIECLEQNELRKNLIFCGIGMSN